MLSRYFRVIAIERVKTGLEIWAVRLEEVRWQQATVTRLAGWETAPSGNRIELKELSHDVALWTAGKVYAFSIAEVVPEGSS